MYVYKDKTIEDGENGRVTYWEQISWRVGDSTTWQTTSPVRAQMHPIGSCLVNLCNASNTVGPRHYESHKPAKGNQIHPVQDLHGSDFGGDYGRHSLVLWPQCVP
jgi:hypothetical protein